MRKKKSRKIYYSDAYIEIDRNVFLILQIRVGCGGEFIVYIFIRYGLEKNNRNPKPRTLIVWRLKIYASLVDKIW